MPVEINGYTEGGLERMRASSEAVMKTVEDGMVTRGAAFVQFPQGCGWWRGLVRRMLLALHGHYRGGLVVASERSVLDDVFSGAPAVEMHVRNTVNIACSERIAKSKIENRSTRCVLALQCDRTFVRRLIRPLIGAGNVGGVHDITTGAAWTPVIANMQCVFFSGGIWTLRGVQDLLCAEMLRAPLRALPSLIPQATVRIVRIMQAEAGCQRFVDAVGTLPPLPTDAAASSDLHTAHNNVTQARHTCLSNTSPEEFEALRTAVRNLVEVCQIAMLTQCAPKGSSLYAHLLAVLRWEHSEEVCLVTRRVCTLYDTALSRIVSHYESLKRAGCRGIRLLLCAGPTAQTLSEVESFVRGRGVEAVVVGLSEGPVVKEGVDAICVTNSPCPTSGLKTEHLHHAIVSLVGAGCNQSVAGLVAQLQLLQPRGLFDFVRGNSLLEKTQCRRLLTELERLQHTWGIQFIPTRDRYLQEKK